MPLFFSSLIALILGVGLTYVGLTPTDFIYWAIILPILFIIKFSPFN